MNEITTKSTRVDTYQTIEETNKKKMVKHQYVVSMSNTPMGGAFRDYALLEILDVLPVSVALPIVNMLLYYMLPATPSNRMSHLRFKDSSW